jgi:hypothetical protein
MFAWMGIRSWACPQAQLLIQAAMSLDRPGELAADP